MHIRQIHFVTQIVQPTCVGLILCAIALHCVAEQPNIVFIMADDLGWADVGFHQGDAPTPHLDRLAAEGLELTQHYVAPVCSPTRAALLTGRNWSRFGVANPQNDLALPWDTVTLPRALKRVGYKTCLTGKWHLGSLPEQGPNHFGFDHSYGSLAGGVSPWNHRYKKGPFTRTWQRDDVLLEEKGHVTDLIAAEAVHWIEKSDDTPYFLYVPFTAVHLPIKEPDEWLKQVPASIQGDVPRHYAASIMHMDAAVHQIWTALKDKGELEKTFFVFTSDNGGSTGENNDPSYPDDNCPNGRLPGNNLPLRGHKTQLYEGGTRVPTIVSWPGHIRPGRCDTAVQIIDWMPTFCSLAGAATDPTLKLDGVDLGPLFLKHEALTPRSLYAVGPGWGSRSLRYGAWKLIVYERKEHPQVELFNLATDPYEKQNLAESQPEEIVRLSAKLAEAAKSDRDAVATP